MKIENTTGGAPILHECCYKLKMAIYTRAILDCIGEFRPADTSPKSEKYMYEVQEDAYNFLQAHKDSKYFLYILSRNGLTEDDVFKWFEQDKRVDKIQMRGLKNRGAKYGKLKKR